MYFLNYMRSKLAVTSHGVRALRSELRLHVHLCHLLLIFMAQVILAFIAQLILSFGFSCADTVCTVCTVLND